MRKANINITKNNKKRLSESRERADGTRRKFLSVVLKENRDGTDKYGNDGFVVEEVTREECETGIRGVFLGNWERLLAKVKEIKMEDSIPLRDNDLPF